MTCGRTHPQVRFRNVMVSSTMGMRIQGFVIRSGLLQGTKKQWCSFCWQLGCVLSSWHNNLSSFPCFCFAFSSATEAITGSKWEKMNKGGYWINDTIHVEVFTQISSTSFPRFVLRKNTHSRTWSNLLDIDIWCQYGAPYHSAWPPATGPVGVPSALVISVSPKDASAIEENQKKSIG